jgi:hypothetical protein
LNQTSWQTFLANEKAEIILDNLIEDTKYYYQLTYKLPSQQMLYIDQNIHLALKEKLISHFHLLCKLTLIWTSKVIQLYINYV